MNRRQELQDLRRMKLKELYMHVQELQNERIRLEARLRGGTEGGGFIRQGYTTGFKGNLGSLRRRIARAKTVLLERQRVASL